MARILKSTKDMPREEWLELRRHSIGGSDAACVVGLNQWKSAFTLFYDKKGEIKDTPDNEKMRIGRDLEDYVAKRFCEATGKKVRRKNAMYLHDDYDFISANIDREIVGENAGLECKTTSAFTRSDFESGQIPLYYYCQCMHYMAVMGYTKMYLAVLVLGQAFYWFEIERNEAEIENLINAEVSFWQNYIEKNTPPPVDGSDSTSSTLAEIYGDASGECTIFGFEGEAKSYIEIGQKIKELKEVQERYKNELLKAMEDCETASLDGYEITNKSTSRTTVDSKKLKAEMPKIYNQYAKTTESRRFVIKEVETA